MTKLLLALALIAAPLMAQTKTHLYAASGKELTQYDLDTAAFTLQRQSSVTLPENIQEAWPGLSHKFLYVAWSDGGATSKGANSGITAFHVDPSGAPSPAGKPISLPTRPIFITLDADGTHIIAAHNFPSRLTVYRILSDGTPGAPVEQSPSLDFGIYGHQVRTDPSGKTVTLVTRGNGPTATTPEDPGALKIFGYKDGILSNSETVAPNKGFGYQARHLDYHPSGKWVFVTLERQNQLHVYARNPDGAIAPAPLFAKTTLMNTTKDGPGQTTASLHFHPNGKYLYVANRGADATGENSIAVFSVNDKTGEPTLIQSVETHGYEPRTFTLNPAGKVLVVGNQLAKNGTPASLAIYAIHDDGTLEYKRKYDVPSCFWAGIL